jgi:hypothetical protein
MRIRTYLRTVSLTGVGAALTVAGAALASGGSGGDGPSDAALAEKSVSVSGPIVDPKNLTHATYHVIDNGQAKVVRLDAGKVVSATDSSITVGENDGNQVTIPVDGDTEVLAGPFVDPPRRRRPRGGPPGQRLPPRGRRRHSDHAPPGTRRPSEAG